MTSDEIMQAAKEAGYGTAFYLNDDKLANEEIWGGPMETQKVRSLIKIIEKRTIERCAAKLLSIGALGDGDFLAAIRALPTGQIKLEELL